MPTILQHHLGILYTRQFLQQHPRAYQVLSDQPLPQDPHELLDKAREQKREAAVQSTLVFLGFVVGGLAVIAKRPKAGKLLVESGGFHPTPKSPLSLARPTPLALTFALPIPFGAVPPEEFSINPNALGEQFPFIPFQQTLGLKVEPERMAAFEVKSFQQYLRNYEVVGKNRRPVSPQELQLLFEQYAALDPGERVGEQLLAGHALYAIQKYAEEHGIPLQPPPIIHRSLLQPVEPNTSSNTTRAAVDTSGANAAQRLQQANPPDP